MDYVIWPFLLGQAADHFGAVLDQQAFLCAFEAVVEEEEGSTGEGYPGYAPDTAEDNQECNLILTFTANPIYQIKLGLGPGYKSRGLRIHTISVNYNNS